MSSPTTSSLSPSFRGSSPARRPAGEPARSRVTLLPAPPLPPLSAPMPAGAIAWEALRERLAGTGRPVHDLLAGLGLAAVTGLLWFGTLAAVAL